MNQNIPDRQEFILLLEDLLEKYPPTPLPFVTTPLLVEISDNTIKAFKEIIDEYPELLLFESFKRIYLPQKTSGQIADKILSPETLNKKKKKEQNKERSNERGLSNSNKILLEAETIISRPDELIERYQCQIDKIQFHSLLIIAYRLRESGKSIDDYFTKQHYADDIRKLIAHSLYIIYEVGIMFREELYKTYEDKTKTIKKIPETDEYYKDAQKLKIVIRGKQTKRDTIINDAEEYREYIMNGSPGILRNRRFYEEKRFRYMAVLVVRINDFFQKEVKESKKESSSLRNKRQDTSRFSIDSYINEAINKPRPIHGVMLITLPAVSIKANCTQT